MEPNGATQVSADGFRAAFGRITPLIKEEWPGLDDQALAGTEGDLEKVVDLVAAHVERTRVAVRRQLGELHALATRAPEGHKDLDGILSTVRRLEALAADEAKRVRAAMQPRVEAKVRENVWTSLFWALGIGFILGILFGGRRRG